MKKNKLHIVNKWNKPAFMQETNLFPEGGIVRFAPVTELDTRNINTGMSNTVTAATAQAGKPKNVNAGSLNFGNDGKGGNGAGIALASSALDAIGGIVNNTKYGQKKTAVGSALKSIAPAATAINPYLGLAVTAGSIIADGGFGYTFNEEGINNVKSNTAGIRSSVAGIGNASTTEDLANRWGQTQRSFAFDKDYIGEDGWFTDEVANKYRELKRDQARADLAAAGALAVGAKNVDNTQDSNVMRRFAAFGGPIGVVPQQPGGALSIMQQDKYLDTINNRSNAIASKNPYMQTGFTGGAKTFDGGGNMLALDFMNTFGSDPIGAVTRYNKELENLAAREELLRRSEQQAMQNELLQQQVEDLRLTPPNFSVNITQDYGFDGIPMVPKIDIKPIESPSTVGKVNPELGLYSLPSKAASDDRIYDTLPQMLKDAGLDVKVTSGYREAGKVGKAGNKSWHTKHGAVDIVPQGSTTYADIEKAVLTNPEIRSYMLVNNYGYLDETDRTNEGKLLMSKTGATGNHFHFGRDTSARNNYLQRVNLNAFGGELGTNGTDFTNGLLYIDEGGSHESNAFGGVPMGIDAEGIPNLVEEGETVYNDYVFSDRMVVPNFMLKELGLGGALKKHPASNKGISFADASKKLAKESEQRPNDPISQAGLEASLSKLAEIQETERMKKQAEEYVGLEYACGGKLGNKYAGTNPKGQKIRRYEFDPNSDFKYWNREELDYDPGYRDFVENKLNEDWINRAMSGQYGDMSRYKRYNNFNPTVEQARELGLDGLISDWHKAMASAYDEYQAGIDPKTGVASVSATTKNWEQEAPWIFGTSQQTEQLRPLEQIAKDKSTPDRTITVDGNGTNLKATQNAITRTSSGITDTTFRGGDRDTYEEFGEPKKYATWMRYAPAAGAGLMALTDVLGLTNKPDYTYADKLEAAAERAGHAPSIRFNPIGNYLTYNPMDIWYEQNRMDANARATERAIANSGVSQGAKNAAYLAAGYNNQLASGDLYRKALEYNDAKRERVADFNRRTDMFNSQMGLEAAMANARYAQQASQMGLSGLAQAAALRDSIDARIGAAKSANLSNFLTSLGNIGRENFAMNQINTDRSRNYYGDLTGDASGYKRKKKSCGGKMNRK